MTYDVRNPFPVCGQTCICSAVKPELDFNPSVLVLIISFPTKYGHKQTIKKTCTDPLTLKQTIYYQKNE